MNFNSVEEVEAFSGLQIEKEINKIEAKINNLRYMPQMAVAAIAIYLIGMHYIGYASEYWVTIMFVGLIIMATDQASVKRTELLKELFKLKYGNKNDNSLS